jgi:uncharacterized membrane protein YfcA
VVPLALIAAGLAAGFVDSIAGGGGLVSLPSLMLVVGPGAVAIGTNKIVGATGALVALVVYARRGHMDWRRSLAFAAWVGAGALTGSRVAPYAPARLFPLLLGITCPVILFIVWRRDLWLAQTSRAATTAGAGRHASFDPKVALVGLVCGFYDGVWGPGGGTFMFLGLHFFVGLPLVGALAAAKLANSASALVALASYAQGGFVRWHEGATLAVGMAAGALLGARAASRDAQRIVRPGLAIVALLLLVKVLRG